MIRPASSLGCCSKKARSQYLPSGLGPSRVRDCDASSRPKCDRYPNKWLFGHEHHVGKQRERKGSLNALSEGRTIQRPLLHWGSYYSSERLSFTGRSVLTTSSTMTIRNTLSKIRM